MAGGVSTVASGVSGRTGRNGSGDPSEAATGDRNAPLLRRGRYGGARFSGEADRGHQPRLAFGDRRRQVPRRSLLSAVRGFDSDAVAGRSDPGFTAGAARVGPVYDAANGGGRSGTMPARSRGMDRKAVARRLCLAGKLSRAGAVRTQCDYPALV